jgi:leucyl aminopeptidase
MIQLISKHKENENIVYIISKKAQIKKLALNNEEQNYVHKIFDNKSEFVHLNSLSFSKFIVLANEEKEINLRKETLRNLANKIANILNELKNESINILDLTDKYALDFAEALSLSTYSFNKYFNNKEDKSKSLKSINIISDKISKKEVLLKNSLCAGVFVARDIINEPASFMTAQKLGNEIVDLSKKYGFKAEVFDKAKIESLKMGGLLAVNRGSVEPPTFSVLSYEPKNAVNKDYIVLVGKGLVFDTGGINLKPSGFLETMKSDKSGAAAVVGAISAIAKAKLPIKIIGLIPSTDNRPGNNAYVPEDIIKMFDGTTVEVMNTDAEGRLILADALAYAKKYNPELVIDVATLTGAAVVAIGENATAIMGNSEKHISELKKTGFEVWERLVEFPLWDDYAEQLKSQVADMKNVGPRWGGAITAAKFLEHFTDYNWVHLDIAGTAFTEKNDSYRGNGGTGIGVRLLFNYFLKTIK